VTAAGPLPDGHPVTGALGAAVTTADGTDVAEDEPLAFRAGTRTRSVLSMSTVFRVYVLSVAPVMVEQLPPSLSHRDHRNANVIGWVPSHVPGEAVSADPSRAVPLTVGGAVLVGAAVAAAPPEAVKPPREAATDATTTAKPPIKSARVLLLITRLLRLDQACSPSIDDAKTRSNRLLTAS
jgi:hypothetical protein